MTHPCLVAHLIKRVKGAEVYALYFRPGLETAARRAIDRWLEDRELSFDDEDAAEMYAAVGGKMEAV